MSSDQSSSLSDLAKQLGEKLEAAKIELNSALIGVDARAAFVSYALSRFAQLHSSSSSQGMRPAPVAVELAAWLLFPYFGSTGSDDAEGIQRAIDALENYQSAHAFAGMFSQEQEYDELDSHLRIFTANVRGSAYPIQVRKRIEGVFSNVDELLQGSAQIGPIRTLELALAILAQTEENIHAMKSRFHDARIRLEKLQSGLSVESDEESAADLRAKMIAIVAEMGGAWIPLKDQIEQRGTNLTSEEWEAVHGILGFSVKTCSMVQRVVDMQDRPLYFVDHDRVFSLQGTTVLDAIFSHFDEIARNDPKVVNRYVDSASDWMEGAIADQMCRLFPEDCIMRSACFRDPDNEGGETEADVIVVWGPFLVVLEAKNNRVAKNAVRGDGKGLKNVISKNIQNAFYQARRVVRVLEEDRQITFKEKATGRILTISYDRLRRVMPISVTLQHLYGIATQLAVTQRLGLFKGNAFPWSVCIDDLDVITRFSESPDVFLYYIERRTAHQGLSIRLNGDELDMFGHFVDNRLHPSIYENRKEISSKEGPVSISFSGLEEKFEPFYVADWYGEESQFAKPALKLPETILAFLSELRMRTDDDARFIAFALLSLNHNALMRIDHAVKSFREGTGPEYQILRSTINEDDIVVNVMVHRSLEFRELFENVTVRTRLEHYRAKAKATVSFAIDLRKAKAFDIAQWLEGEWEYEQALEEALQNDRGQTRLFHLPKGSKKLGRNVPCPCGSGLKFKKCCIDQVQVR